MRSSKKQKAQHLLRRRNRTLVWRAIEELPTATRVSIARQTKLSFPAVSKIVAALAAEGFVLTGRRETPVARGRPSEVLRINPRAGTIVGIDVEPKYIRFVQTDFCFDELRRHEVRHACTRAAIVSRVCDELAAFLKTRTKAKSGKPLCIGLGVTGVVDHAAGHLVHSSFLGLDGCHLGQALHDSCGLPVYVENNANLEAVCVHTLTEVRTEPNLVCLSVKQGVGAGLILNGQLYSGARGRAGEVGWMAREFVDRFDARRKADREAFIVKMIGMTFAMLDVGHVVVAGDIRRLEGGIRRRIEAFPLRSRCGEVSFSRFAEMGVCMGAAVHARRGFLQEKEFRDDFRLWSAPNHTEDRS